MNLGLKQLSIQVTQDCNFACGMCGFQKYHRSQPNERPLNIDINFFAEVIKQYKFLEQDTPKLVTLSAGNEPLLHPEILDFCNRLNQIGLNFGFDTNASLLSSEVANELLMMSHFKRIVFSIDGYTRETFEKIRINSSFDQVKLNVLDFLAQLNSLNRHDIYTRVNIVAQKVNAHELDDLIRFWSPKVKQVNVSCLRVGKTIMNLNWMPPKRVPCQFLWEHLRVLTDGSVIICCIDDEFSLKVSNLRNTNLETIWFGQEYQRMREIHTEGRWEEMPLCRDCNCWAGFFAPRSFRRFTPEIIVGEKPGNIVAMYSDPEKKSTALS